MQFRKVIKIVETICILFQGELEGLLDKFDGFQMSSSSSLAFKTFRSVYTFRVASLKIGDC